MTRRKPRPREATRWIAAVAVAAATARLGLALGPSPGPFAFLEPWITLTESERERLERDDVVIRVLPAGGDGHVSVIGISRLDAEPDALTRWTRSIAALKRGEFVQAAGRLSDPPTLADFTGLTLDPQDLDDLRRCVPDDCDVKLTRTEIDALQRALALAGDGWREAARTEFARIALARVRLYMEGGAHALSPTADRSGRATPADALTAIVTRSPYLTRLPAIAHWLDAYPDVEPSEIESFFYWSKERYGGGKPVIAVTHVGMLTNRSVRRGPAVVVAGAQVFASHYFEGSLGLTMVVSGAPGASYLVYLNRSQVDVLRGVFGGLVRGVVEGRLAREAPRVMRGLRERLESGAPPHGELETR